MIIWLFINKMHRYSVNIEQVEQDDMTHVLLSRDTPRISGSLIRIIAHHRGLASFMSPAHFRRLRPFLTISTKLHRKTTHQKISSRIVMQNRLVISPSSPQVSSRFRSKLVFENGDVTSPTREVS